MVYEDSIVIFQCGHTSIMFDMLSPRFMREVTASMELVLVKMHAQKQEPLTDLQARALQHQLAWRKTRVRLQPVAPQVYVYAALGAACCAGITWWSLQAGMVAAVLLAVCVHCLCRAHDQVVSRTREIAWRRRQWIGFWGQVATHVADMDLRRVQAFCRVSVHDLSAIMASGSILGTS